MTSPRNNSTSPSKDSSTQHHSNVNSGCDHRWSHALCPCPCLFICLLPWLHGPIYYTSPMAMPPVWRHLRITNASQRHWTDLWQNMAWFWGYLNWIAKKNTRGWHLAVIGLWSMGMEENNSDTKLLHEEDIMDPSSFWSNLSFRRYLVLKPTPRPIWDYLV